MHAYIITGSTEKKRREWIDTTVNSWNIRVYDRREIISPDASIGIERIRQFKHALSFAPTGKMAVGIVWGAHRLTQDGQNALLKTLEEPPPSSHIILESSFIDALLPTIISRCVITDLGSSVIFSQTDRDEWLATWTKLNSLSPGRMLDQIDTIAADRTAAQQWIYCGIEALESCLKKNPEEAHKNASDIRRLLRARRDLEANEGPKLVLDLLLLHNHR